MPLFRSASGDAAMVRLETGTDLLEALGEAAAELGMRAGAIQLIGAVSELALAYYDQDAAEYRDLRTPGHWEIASGLGNVSLRDGEPFVHVHLVCTGADGHAVGGHLTAGTTVFMVEAFLQALDGEPPVRTRNERIGLDVWH
ncbi:MAG: DNA-binding protein [Actinomycetota bacterium]|nr:DNA-binding protein [Actinomycetota bacterium]